MTAAPFPHGYLNISEGRNIKKLLCVAEKKRVVSGGTPSFSAFIFSEYLFTGRPVRPVNGL